jgi:hypothetical protein
MERLIKVVIIAVFSFFTQSINLEVKLLNGLGLKTKTYSELNAF